VIKGIDLEGIVAIVGNYGSGKTEVAINLAVARRLDGVDVGVADLDLVNPYFRTREAREQLTGLGIDVVLPAERYLHADLPIVSRKILGLLGQPNQLTLLDAGGDDVGATVLASLADGMAGRKVQVLQVVNPLRPFTDTISGCMTILEEIEAAARLRVTGFIGNANLIDETTVETIVSGYGFLQRLSSETGLPLAFVTAPRALMPNLDVTRIDCPVLCMDRQLVPPWKKAASLPAAR
jgi:hypothetical protein